MRKPILIVGTGMAGLGAAYAIRATGANYLMVDQRSQPGGHTSSWTNPQGFTFDEGPHISFTTNEQVQKLLAENLGNEYEESGVAVNNYWQQRWIKHPAQCNLSALPNELIVRILTDYLEAYSAPQPEIRSYEDWLVATYGETFARTFPVEYGLKYHTAPANRMSTDWLGPRLYKPKPEEVFRGALAGDTDDVHYVKSFRYPKKGGFVSFLAPLWKGANMLLGQRIVRIDTSEKIAITADGTAIPFGKLISSMPLPEVIRCLPNAPEDVREAASRLACTECVAINIGVSRSNISDYHWTYFYDKEVIFARVSFPHMFSTGNAPPGCGSIQAEIYFSEKYRPRHAAPESFIEPVKRDLRSCGLLKESDEILSEEAMLLSHANVIFDHDRAPAVEIVHGFLREQGIEYCGRYGDWGYSWTDESFVSGERAAHRALA